ncbi:hypothetical protein [Halostella salina]|uniref:hypothetical protein n=1 Tax=Halostella salina TaxID=1547897 RepID=UPI000EF7687B|nr:hypothetical protein [Halostella salina]
MAYADWNHYDSNSTHQIQQATVSEGNAALQIDHGDQIDGVKAEILSESVTDSPSEGRIETMGYADGTSAYLGFHSRFVDTDNFYFALVWPYTDETIFGYFEGGNRTYDRLDNSETLSELTWHELRYDIWEDSGSVWQRVSYHDGADWVMLSEKSDSVYHNGGGGMGVGAKPWADGAATQYFDDTMVYY